MVRFRMCVQNLPACTVSYNCQSQSACVRTLAGLKACRYNNAEMQLSALIESTSCTRTQDTRTAEKENKHSVRSNACGGGGGIRRGGGDAQDASPREKETGGGGGEGAGSLWEVGVSSLRSKGRDDALFILFILVLELLEGLHILDALQPASTTTTALKPDRCITSKTVT